MVEARQAASTVRFLDTYCELYKNLFVEVRAYEYFKYIHLGLISDIKRKSLPEIAKVVGLENAQGLHHFVKLVTLVSQRIRVKKVRHHLNCVRREGNRCDK